jgi:hypothetical protein
MNDHDLKRDIDLFWSFVDRGWSIEPRAYFELHARKNGFESPLAMAAHHMWKRDPKITTLRARIAALMPSHEDPHDPPRSNGYMDAITDVLALLDADADNGSA